LVRAAENPPTPIDSIKDATLRNKLTRMAEQYRELTVEAGAIEVSKKALMPKMVAIAERLKLDKVLGAGWLFAKSAGRRVLKVDLLKARLLEEGMEVELVNEIVEWAMVEGEPSWSVRAVK
jgi:hypothetical protein